MDYRMERDSMGEMEVPADRYWGAQTLRSYQNFQIGTEKMPEEIVRADLEVLIAPLGLRTPVAVRRDLHLPH